MKMSGLWSALLAVALAFPAFAGAANSEQAKKEKEEEALREQARKLLGEAQGGRTPFMGRLALIADAATDAKPFPKIIGFISKDGAGYPVLVLEKPILERLSAYDNKDVTLMGKVIDRGDKGKVFATDELVVPPATREIRRKRGGL